MNTIRTHKWAAVFILLILFLPATISLAAEDTIPRAFIGSGGGRMSSDGLTLLVAIGEPAAGSVSNELRLGSGYLGRPAFDGYSIYLPLVLR